MKEQVLFQLEKYSLLYVYLNTPQLYLSTDSEEKSRKVFSKY